MDSSDKQEDDDTPSTKYANRHVPRFLNYDNNNQNTSSSSPLQIVTDGSKLTCANIKNGLLNISNPILVQDTPASIGLKVPSNNKNKPFTVREIMNVVGHHYPVSVIDVALQEELDGWTMEDLVEYFEDESRLQCKEEKQVSNTARPRRRAAVEAAAAAQEQNRPKVLNQISMEFSKTPLQRLVVRPQFVRDMDWIDIVWPIELRQQGQYPVVQHYCLTSTIGCFTDFHIDFGGTAVWYHVLEGQKEFILIPPTRSNLQKYEEWLCHKQQAELFLPDILESQHGVVKVTLEKSKTLVIPTGWIHAVYTPLDSVVIGGNFLHGLDMALQLSIYCVETRAKVLDRFRFPFFCPIMYFAGAYYLERLKQGDLCRREVEGLPELIKALQEWWKMHSKQPKPTTTVENNNGKNIITAVGAAYRAAQMSNCESVDQMLEELQEQHERIVKHGISPLANYSPATTAKPPPMKKKLSIKLATPEEKPKLRLKLSSGGSPKEEEDDDDDDSTNNFRIVLPQSSMYALPSKKRKSMFSREDIVDAGSIIGKDDDEWKPSGGRRKSNTASRPSVKPKPIVVSCSKQAAAVPPARRDSGASRKKATTSRQRLMKRFR